MRRDISQELDLLERGQDLHVRTINNIVVYFIRSYKRETSDHSECFDRETNKQLDIDDVTDDYGLILTEDSDGYINVMIPRGRECYIHKHYSRSGTRTAYITIRYNKIICRLEFEDPLEYFFEIIDD